MVNNMHWEQFIYRPLWQQNILLGLLSLLIFIVAYYWMISPMMKTINTQYLLITEEQQKIELLKYRIRSYPEDSVLSQQYLQLKQQISPVLTEKQIEVLLTQHIKLSEMRLLSLQKQHQDLSLVWQIELQGSYQQFIAFIQSAIAKQVPWGIQSLTIDKMPSGLLFSFRVSYEPNNRANE